MLRRIILFLSICSLAHPQEQLKVITCNIEGYKPGSQPLTRLTAIIQNLKRLDPDIIGLQEINESPASGGRDNQARIIADSLSAYFRIPYSSYCSGTHMAWSGLFREMIGIITKHPVEFNGFASLASGTFPRKVVWNQIVTPLGRINFFNTHLDGESTGATKYQVKQVLAYISQCDSTNPAAATILTGDLNNTPESESITTLSAALADTWFQVNPLSPGYTVPSDAPNIKIDYILFKSKKIKPVMSSIIMTETFQGAYPSDHAGVLTLFEVDPTTVESRLQTPLTLQLAQNYPNPFNARTVITYRLAMRGAVSLRVYDLGGREVAILLDEAQSAGEHAYIFDAGGLVSGTYFYRLSTPDGIQTRKMVVLR